MDIILPKIKINQKDLQLNLELFDIIYKAIQNAKNNSQNIIILEDNYYNSFYDGEISLFWLFFKTYTGLRNLENNISNNFDCLHILSNPSLTKINKPHVLKFVHDLNIDFFTNLKKINPHIKSLIFNCIQESNINYNKFIEYINCCGNEDYWRFTEKNIEKLLSNSTFNQNIDSHDKEKIFLAKNISNYSNTFNSFYYSLCLVKNINEEEFKFKKNFLKFLNQIIEINNNFDQLILLIEIDDQNEMHNFIEFINNIKNCSYFERILFLIINKKNVNNIIPFDFLKSKINSSITFYNEQISYFDLVLKNPAASFLINLLKGQYKVIINDDYIQKQKIRQLSYLVFKSLFLGITKINKLKTIFNDLFRFSDIDLLNQINIKIEDLNKTSGENIFNLENNIINYIKTLNIKKIFISKSNFCLTQEDLFIFKDWLTDLIKDLNISIEILNKNYPLELSKEYLLIYLGEDIVSRYFNNKINILNIKLDYNMEELDFDMISDLEKRKEDIFLIKSYQHSEIIPSNKQVLYFLENDFNIYTDNIQDIYECGIEKAFILTDYSHIKKYCQKFIENYSKNSQTRNKIKVKANEKMFNKKNTMKYNRKEYYLYLSNIFISTLNDKEKQDYSHLIKNNLCSWFEKSTLPRDSVLFLKFLEFINLKEEAKILFNEHRYETSLNQSGGREISKQIQTIFDKEWEDNEDYNQLINELKSSKLFKECIITIKNGE